MANPSTDSRELRPAVSVDVVILTIFDDALRVLLVKRTHEPFQDMWALPGGFVRADESLEDAARRQLLEKTGVADIYLEQLYTFGDQGRDPRLRVITVAYYALVPVGMVPPFPQEGGGAVVAWWPVAAQPPLAFDHAGIVVYTLSRLRNKLDYTPVGVELLPERFTLSQLQRVYEMIMGKSVDKRNFRKKIRGKEWLERTEGTQRDGPHRPAQLFRFRPRTARYTGT
jgi:8-oxo-dGTP diphosphatase